MLEAGEELEGSEEVKGELQEVEIDQTAHISLQAITGIPSFCTMAVAGQLGDRCIYILIDTGSTHNFVDPLVIDETKVKLESIQKQVVRLATGDRLGVKQLVSKLCWKMGGVQFTADALILPLGSYDMILGMQWLTTLGSIQWKLYFG
ncbi:hypothetical protein AXF42_Ash009523 [Apostasia shenzhenica]|uniref:Uncharacterized protein n=1 Tax=Apostasia shenzhenica TaxID=1088818 RepID=A0A2I0B935_9ASPA|nr:hypothetical protein AXF42_Ash009523 [Apostasia shenzhenica]